MTFPSPFCACGVEGWSEKPNTQGQFDIQWLFNFTQLTGTLCEAVNLHSGAGYSRSNYKYIILKAISISKL